MFSVIIRHNITKNRAGFLLKSSSNIIGFECISNVQEDSPIKVQRELLHNALDVCIDFGITIESVNIPEHDSISANSFTDIVQKYYPNESILLNTTDSAFSYFLEGILSRNAQKQYIPEEELPQEIVVQSDMSYKDGQVCYGYIVTDISEEKLYGGKSRVVPTPTTNRSELEKAAGSWSLLQFSHSDTDSIILQMDNSTAVDTFESPTDIPTEKLTVECIDRGKNKFADILAKSALHFNEEICL